MVAPVMLTVPSLMSALPQCCQRTLSQLQVLLVSQV